MAEQSGDEPRVVDAPGDGRRSHRVLAQDQLASLRAFLVVLSQTERTDDRMGLFSTSCSASRDTKRCAPPSLLRAFLVHTNPSLRSLAVQDLYAVALLLALSVPSPCRGSLTPFSPGLLTLSPSPSSTLPHLQIRRHRLRPRHPQRPHLHPPLLLLQPLKLYLPRRPLQEKPSRDSSLGRFGGVDTGSRGAGRACFVGPGGGRGA